jgi:hypothetical protein
MRHRLPYVPLYPIIAIVSREVHELAVIRSQLGVLPKVHVVIGLEPTALDQEVRPIRVIAKVDIAGGAGSIHINLMVGRKPVGV